VVTAGRNAVTSSAVQTFHIKVTPTASVRKLRVVAQWQNSSTSGEIQLESLRMRTLQMLVGLLRTNRLSRIEELMLLGEHLFASLFGVETSEHDDYTPRALFLRAMAAPAGGAERRLTQVSLEIDKDVAALGSWPWEYLFVPDRSGNPKNGFFLGDRTNFVLTRRYPFDDDEQWEHIRPPLRILFVVLSPMTDDHPLSVIEYRAVLETLIQLRDAQGPERINLRVLTEEHDDAGNPLPDDEIGNTTRTSYAAFRLTVEDFYPHVVHIIGHGRYIYEDGVGSSGQLAFPPYEDATANWVSDWDLSNVLRDIPSLRLVFLQACESAATQYSPYEIISGLAVQLAQRNIPAVIAMHFQVKGALANEFARAFYDKMKERTEIEIAMHAARRQLFVSGVMGESSRAGFGLPVLYLRGSGALLTPLEVPAPTVRSVLAAETDRPAAPRETQPYRPTVPRQADRRRGDAASAPGYHTDDDLAGSWSATSEQR
jgi:hypothetical protein